MPTGKGTFTGAIHMVRRIPGGTALYWSVAPVEEGGATPQMREAVRWRGDFNDVTGNNGLYTVRLVDTSTGTVYKPLIDARNGTACLCTSSIDFPSDVAAGELQLAYAVFPELPAATTAVEVDVNGYGGIISGVPVTEGDVPGPAPEEDLSTVPLGQGWPQPPGPDALRAAGEDAEHPAVWDLITRTGTTDESERTVEQGASTQVELASDVLFGVDEAELTVAARETLAGVVAQIEDAGTDQVAVVGHTDDVGSDSHNQDLSQRRARAVEAALAAELDVDITVEGRGESEPVADNASEAGRALNRRVTITFERSRS